eukprot:4178013-Prymnesium_polylepis.2
MAPAAAVRRQRCGSSSPPALDGRAVRVRASASAAPAALAPPFRGAHLCCSRSVSGARRGRTSTRRYRKRRIMAALELRCVTAMMYRLLYLMYTYVVPCSSHTGRSSASSASRTWPANRSTQFMGTSPR